MYGEPAKVNPSFRFSWRRFPAAIGLCCLGVALIAWIYSVQGLFDGSFLQRLFILAFFLVLATIFGAAICLVVPRPVPVTACVALVLLIAAILVGGGSHARPPSSMGNLREVGIAMNQYEAQYGQLPAQAIFSANGRPLLSWRVSILPYIAQEALYDQFHLDEPWNSPHNQTLIRQMPEIYATPGLDASDHRTAYLTPTGPNTAFDRDKPVTLDAIAANHRLDATILVVEVDPDLRVIWTKPEDLEVDFDHPLNGLGHAQKDGFLALFADGKVRMIPADIEPKDLKLLGMPHSAEKPRPGSF